MNTNSVELHKAALTQFPENRTLGEGSSVLVRILKNNGNNSYTAFFAGSKFLINSELLLKEGEVFRAKVKIQNNQVILVQEKNVTDKGIFVLKSEFDNHGNLLNPELVNYFQNLGITADKINFTLFETIKMLALDFDRKKIEKIRNIVKNFKGNETKAAQIALLLEQKGIEPSKEQIENFLFLNNENQMDAELKDFDLFSSSNEDDVEKIILKELFDLKKRIFNGEIKNNEGVLSVFNHLGFKNKGFFQSGSWIIVPFEMKINKNKKNEIISGVINFFINSETKKSDRFAVNLSFFDKKYKFVVYLKQNKIERISFLGNIEKAKLEKEFKGVKVTFCSSEEELDFPVFQNDIFSVNELV